MSIKWSVMVISVEYLLLLKSHVKGVLNEERSTKIDSLRTTNGVNNAFKSPMVIVRLGFYKQSSALKTRLEISSKWADQQYG